MNKAWEINRLATGRRMVGVGVLLVLAMAVAMAVSAGQAYAATDGSAASGKLQAAQLGTVPSATDSQAAKESADLGLARVPAVGTKFKVGGNVYKITDEYENSHDLGEAVLVKYGSNKLKPVVNTVKYKGATYEVEQVGKGAFNNSKGHKITSVTLGAHVDSIASKAFYGCSKLKTINIAKSDVIDVEYSSRLGKYQLDDVNIGAQAFKKAGVKNVKVKCGSSNASYQKAVKKALTNRGLRSTAKVVK